MTQNDTKRLINKGKQNQPAPLLEQARVHVALGRKHVAPLTKFGWPPTHTDILESKITELDVLSSSRSSAATQSLTATQTEAAMRRQAKSYIRCLRNSLPMALRQAGDVDVTMKSFDAGESLGNSTVKITAYLTKVRPFVKILNDVLTPYFGGENPSEKLEAVKADLESADTVQETKRQSLPEGTAKIYLLSGEILEMIEDMNRIGKNAFDGQSEMIAQFNKDILLRGGSKPSSKTTGDTETGDTDTTAE